MRAVEDADKSIVKKRSEIKAKATDLEEIKRTRMKATLAARKFKSGDNDSSPIKEKKIIRVKKSRKITPKSSSSSSSSSSNSSSENETPKNDLRARLEAKKKRRKISSTQKQSVKNDTKETEEGKSLNQVILPLFLVILKFFNQNLLRPNYAFLEQKIPSVNSETRVYSL